MSFCSRPRIGISTSRAPVSLSFFSIGFAVLLCGGLPVRLRPHRKFKNIQGLILSGGPHVYPSFYLRNHLPHFLKHSYDYQRDSREIAWLQHLLRTTDQEEIPTLGICRGAQVMAVANSGRLHPSLVTTFPHARYPRHPLAYLTFRKKVYLTPGSLMENIFQARDVWVNSLHRQAIDEPGPGFVVTAREGNGIIQAIEHTQKGFCLGVQFHPELMIHRKTMRRLFRVFIERASGKKPC